MKKTLCLILLLVACSVGWAQTSVVGGGSFAPLSGSADPNGSVNCNPANTDQTTKLYYRTATAIGWYSCTATNTWTLMGAAGSGLPDPGGNGIVKRTALNTSAVAVAGTDYVVPAGNVATATALAANPADCAANAYAQSIAANGDLTCKQVAQTDLSAGNYTIGAYYIDQAEIAAPANPSAGVCREYVDSTTHLKTWKNSAGTSCGPATGSGSSAGTQYAVQYSSDGAGGFGGASNGKTGQSFVSTNGAAPSFASPGLPDGNSNAPVTTTPYAVACDSSTAVLDRGKWVVLDSGASVVTNPDSTASGCTGNFLYGIVNRSGGTITVNRSGTDTFNIVDGQNVSTAQTSFTMANGTFASLNNGPSGVWTVRKVANAASSGTTTNALTADNSGAGDASGMTFNGSAAKKISYNTIGAAPFSDFNITTTGLTAGHAYYVSAANTLTEAGGALSATVAAVCVATSTTNCSRVGTYTTTGLTAGSIYYVPTTAAVVTATKPTSTGQYVQRVGVALSTTVLLIQPSLDVGSVQ